MKKCSYCDKSKDESEFYKNNRSPDGLSIWCKECKIEGQRNYTLRNKEKIAEKNRQWRLKNKERLAEQKRQYALRNKEKISEIKRQYNIENKEKIAEKNRRWYLRNKEKVLKDHHLRRQINKEKAAEIDRRYRQNHKEKVAESYWRRTKERLITDPIFKLKAKVRRTIAGALKRKNYTKKSKTHEILRCDYKTLFNHLIATAIENYGFYDPEISYHIDHFIPLATAQTEEEVIKLNHYTNLQYLTPEDNLKKSDQIGWMTEYRRSRLDKPEKS